jgi:hypothetical protein
MTYTMCDCPEYEGPHDPSIQCVLYARKAERARCVAQMRELSRLARLRADTSRLWTDTANTLLVSGAFALAAQALEEDKA